MRLKNLANTSPAETCRHKSNPLINLAVNGKDELPVGFCEPSTQKVTELPLEGADNIMDILDAKPNPVECMVLHSFFFFSFFLFFEKKGYKHFFFHMRISPSSPLHTSLFPFSFFF